MRTPLTQNKHKRMRGMDNNLSDAVKQDGGRCLCYSFSSSFSLVLRRSHQRYAHASAFACVEVKTMQAKNGPYYLLFH